MRKKEIILTTKQIKVLDLVKRKKEFKLRELNCSSLMKKKLREVLVSLIKKNIVKREKKDNNYYYSVKNETNR